MPWWQWSGKGRQIVRVQEQKLTYPALSSIFAEVRQLVESGARKSWSTMQGVSYIAAPPSLA